MVFVRSPEDCLPIDPFFLPLFSFFLLPFFPTKVVKMFKSCHTIFKLLRVKVKLTSQTQPSISC